MIESGTMIHLELQIYAQFKVKVSVYFVTNVLSSIILKYCFIA